jgi:hypothetical protein
MWGTPRASRLTVAGPATGAVISPDVLGNGRIAYQYTAAPISKPKTAMLTFATRTRGFSTHRFYSALWLYAFSSYY